MKVRFDHAAVATNDPEKLKRVLLLLGLADSGSEPLASQGVITHFLKTESSTPVVEILEVTDPQGTVARFIAKRGPGIHHLSFSVEGLDALCKVLEKNAIRLVYPMPRPGARHARVNFIHPESTGGILIEISEKAS